MRICVAGEGAPDRWATRPAMSLGEVDSTQIEARRLADGGAPEGTVVRAEHQTRGRGRLGREWIDERGSALLISIILRPAGEVVRLPQLSLVAGVGVAEGLTEASGLPVTVAWPNDLLIRGLKVAGILAESFPGPGGAGTVVILGIGINVNQTRFAGHLEERATSLAREAGRPFDRERLLAVVLERLESWYRRWAAEGFEPVREAWRRGSATLGQRVAIGQGVEGIAEDLAEDGALLVRTEAGALVRRVATGPAP
ncbi:MAG: biotin--[acetyl-CoA-carboxylase] ligase [Candidatus Rokubacteria bacterium]|nr:biotin--[acetyl-CoA-carboxylase] ligase [Candidatus Rokubacteria bacterium]